MEVGPHHGWGGADIDEAIAHGASGSVRGRQPWEERPAPLVEGKQETSVMVGMNE